MKRMMHEHAEETIVCADHSKFLKKAFKTICQLSDIKGILSDSELSGRYSRNTVLWEYACIWQRNKTDMKLWLLMK